jgi:hypothetical protein
MTPPRFDEDAAGWRHHDLADLCVLEQRRQRTQEREDEIE